MNAAFPIRSARTKLFKNLTSKLHSSRDFCPHNHKLSPLFWKPDSFWHLKQSKLAQLILQAQTPTLSLTCEANLPHTLYLLSDENLAKPSTNSLNIRLMASLVWCSRVPYTDSISLAITHIYNQSLEGPQILEAIERHPNSKSKGLLLVLKLQSHLPYYTLIIGKNCKSPGKQTPVKPPIWFQATFRRHSCLSLTNGKTH